MTWLRNVICKWFSVSNSFLNALAYIFMEFCKILQLVDQEDEGQCNSECKTIERACQEVKFYCLFKHYIVVFTFVLPILVVLIFSVFSRFLYMVMQEFGSFIFRFVQLLRCLDSVIKDVVDFGSC